MASRRRRPRRPGAAALLDRALAEDRVDQDRTSAAVLPARLAVRARLVAQASGTVSGVAIAVRVARRAGVAARPLRADGARVVPGTAVVALAGPARRVLAVERTALNFLMHLSGIATLTRTCVAAARPLAVYATRKTLPGLRAVEKAAVRHGGGHPHRRDLADRLLVKGPHVDLVGLATAVARARRAAGGRPVEVEVRTAAEAEAAARAGARRLLLDNFAPGAAAAALRRLDRLGLRRGRFVELSGGIDPARVARYRATGADALSLGALTHSAPALPFHLVLDAPRATAPR